MIFTISLPLKYQNAIPGIKPSNPVPIAIIGLYGPLGQTIAPIKSPTKQIINAGPAPNKQPETKPTVATKDSCNAELTGISNIFATAEIDAKIEIYTKLFLGIPFLIFI